MDWWNNHEADALSEHSLADTDRDASPIPPALQEDVCREVAGKDEIVGENTDWGSLQDHCGFQRSPTFGAGIEFTVPDLVVSDVDSPVRSVDRAGQGLLASSTSSKTEREAWLSGFMTIQDIKRVMQDDAKEDEALVNTLADELQRTIRSSDFDCLKEHLFARDDDVGFLHGSRPQMSVVDFMSRLLPALFNPGLCFSICRVRVADCLCLPFRMGRYSSASPSCYLVSQIFVNRLKRKLPTLELNSLTFQRLLLSTTMLAAKLHDDFYHSNAVWAKIGGLSTQELNKIELRLLSLLDWNICVSWEEYHYQRLLVRRQRIMHPPAANIDIFAHKDDESAHHRPHHSNPELHSVHHFQVDHAGAACFHHSLPHPVVSRPPSVGVPLQINGAPYHFNPPQHLQQQHQPQPQPQAVAVHRVAPPAGYNDPVLVSHPPVLTVPARHSLNLNPGPAVTHPMQGQATASGYQMIVGQFGGMQIRQGF